MAGPPRRPGSSGSVRRGHRRLIAGLPADVIETVGSDGGGPDHGITQLTGDVTAGPGDGSQAATIAPSAVTTGKIAANAVTTAKILDANVTLAKLVDLAALAVLGRASNSSGVMAAIVAGSDGDVLRRAGTALGFGGIALTSIADGLITLAKLADLAALSVLGRASNSSGVMAAIAAGSDGDVLRRAGTALAFGQIVTAGITDANVTLAKIADLAALSLLGRASNSSGVMAAITAANDGDVLRRSGTALGFGAIATAGLTDAAVTLAKLANLATQTVIGRNTAGTGVPEAVTAAQILDWLGATRGSVLYRGAGGWTALTPGTATYALITGGAGADPAWGPLAGSTVGVGAFFTGTGCPQGVVSAALGAEYIDTATGYHWRKVGGAATAYGWYLHLPNNGMGLGGPAAFANITSGVRAASSGVVMNGYGYFCTGVGDAVEIFTATAVTTFNFSYVSGKIFKTMTSAATLNLNMYEAATTNPRQALDDDLDIWFEFRTGADITNVRLWVGLSASAITDSETFATAGNGSIMFRYSTAVPDGGWIGQTCKNGGANHTETATVAAIAANTTYRLRIRYLASGTVFFSVNDGTEISVATNLPPTGSAYFPIFGLTNKTASAHTVGLRAIGGWQGS